MSTEAIGETVGRAISGVFATRLAIPGMLVASTSLFNMYTELKDVPVVEALSLLRDAYRFVFHSIVDFPLMIFSFDLTGPEKDAIILWFLCGGTTLRWISAMDVMPAIGNSDDGWDNRRRADLIWLSGLTLLLWPILFLYVVLDRAWQQRLTNIRVFSPPPKTVQFGPMFILEQIHKETYTTRFVLFSLAASAFFVLLGCLALIAFNACFGPLGTCPPVS